MLYVEFTTCSKRGNCDLFEDNDLKMWDRNHELMHGNNHKK